MAAVHKTPEPGQYKRPSNMLGNELSRSSGGAFNNLIQRMTGSRDKINSQAVAFGKKQDIGNGLDKIARDKNSPSLTSGGVDKLEVPAFLRRQAN